MRTKLQVKTEKVNELIRSREFTLASIYDRIDREEQKKRLNKYKDAEINWYHDQIRKINNSLSRLEGLIN